MKDNSIQEALNTLLDVQAILKEDLGFGGPMDGYEQAGPQDISHYRGDEGAQQVQQEENSDMDLSKSDERIAQIRQIALDGLQDYAEDVDSEAYQFYKKIWLMCDKAVSEKESASNGGSAA